MSLNKSVLHISTDNKFIEDAKKTFNQVFLNNTYIILRFPFRKIKFVKTDSITNIWSYHFFLLKINSNFFKKFDYIILHDMNYYNSRLVLKNPSLQYVYIPWGYEIYNNNYITHNFHEMKTFLNEKPLKYGLRKSIINLIKYGLLSSEINNHKIISKALSIVKKATFLDNEFEFFKKIGIIHNNCILLPPFLYKPFKDNFIKISKSGKKIIIGHSSIKSIGHIDLFHKLDSYHIDEVIVPLSYGDMKYQKEVINSGKKVFNKAFYPITKFISLQEYKKHFYNSSIYVNNSKRSNGFGNIIICLEMGLKIFLNPVNPIFEYLKKKGGYVWSIEDLNYKNFNFLTEDQIKANQQILKNYYYEKVMIKNWQDALK